MKKLALIIAATAIAVAAFADHGFKLTGRGTGENIGAVTIEAGKNGEVVRGTFTAKVRSPHGAVELRGQIVRLGPDPKHAHVFLFAANCRGSDGVDYKVQGMCKDGDVPERDGIQFTISNRGGQVFRGATNRQVVKVERI